MGAATDLSGEREGEGTTEIEAVSNERAWVTTTPFEGARSATMSPRSGSWAREQPAAFGRGGSPTIHADLEIVG